ncbi:Chemotaxis regulator - transmits chemoreceptor signals to flagellar motor components CheY [Citrifermentans bremense]|uniref:histidine kinase n=1 Tax=Citrifermentans bremense TaxID=60035 RepID=A0A6S6M8A8_9BACT|nr:response regulator [Citrifermentans bremense]BCG47741.1 Chemotaxis regulator - transmits chemoreceptor signals to flagellar motor components CheY [Citrifermentans bremense]
MSQQDKEPRGRVLIVDDEKVILDLTAIILKNRGYQVFTALSAQEGLDCIEKQSPELVLLDYMMPNMDGLTALKEIKRSYPDTYVIMFTGKGSEEIAVELMKAGASDYILKPFNNQDLVDRIESVLKLRGIELQNRALLSERERLLAEIADWNRELERRVQEKSEALRRAQVEVVQSEKLASLGYLSAGMAHEIRNPLNSIALFVQLIKSGLDEHERLDYVEKILKEVDRIDNILGKLLDASKRPKFEISEVRVDRVLEHTLDAFTPQLRQKKIRAVTDFKNIPPAIKADPMEIEQIFTNLFLNSIHVMPEEGTLTVELEGDEQWLTVRVSDTGPGIPPENLPNIFDPFFTTNSRGTGLGLSVVLRIVKTYKGKIEVEKSDNSGTTFLVRLPLAAPR